MKVATLGNVRTANAARESGMNKALKIAFRSGAVMGLCVSGLGLFGLGVVVCVLDLATVVECVTGFGLGASSMALFGRVGGGIYTKAADVGADLVGKVEAGIPEDDPRNPAVIADNVGDNVGDVAGMGSDLFESYVGSIISAITLAAVAVANADETAVFSTDYGSCIPVNHFRYRYSCFRNRYHDRQRKRWWKPCICFKYGNIRKRNYRYHRYRYPFQDNARRLHICNCYHCRPCCRYCNR